MLPPIVTLEKCRNCGKTKLLMNGALKSEWVCPACGKTNKKKPISNLLA